MIRIKLSRFIKLKNFCAFKFYSFSIMNDNFAKFLQVFKMKNNFFLFTSKTLKK